MKHEVKMAIQMQKPLVVAMVDVDNFKKINDTYAHEVGDRALRHIASLLSENMRSGDYLFRYGGEEFLIILVEANKSNAEKFLERIRLKVDQTACPLREGPLQMSISIGFTLHGGHPDYEKLLQQADQGVYEAKRNGRSQMVFLARKISS
ncbi:GGDEF domain-containing protein [Pantoea osteomyelitidis]|uniref:diguanylate cyclase n=1 Tax=Pantoea osteomyelitidis TaxID=3230026 RepID=A0ABW7PS56_9GAMM